MATKKRNQPKQSAKPQPKKAAPKPAKAPARKASSKKAPPPAPPQRKAVQPKPTSPPPQKKALPKPVAAAPSKPVSATPSSKPPSSAPSKSILSPSAGSPTDGGVRYLTAQDIVELHRAISAEFGGNQAAPGLVDSQYGLMNSVQRPQLTIMGREAYPTFAEKAAAFLFAILQNSPFRNSNRRLALISLVAFCEVNHRAIDARVLDEKTVENIIKKASAKDGLPPENVFRDLRDLMSRAISTPS